MKRFMVATATAVALLCLGTIAESQNVPALQQTPPPSSKLNLSMEQEHVVKELLKDQAAAPESPKVPGTVGAAIPADATLRPIPAEIGDKIPQIRAHRYVISNGKIMLVDGKDNAIVHVIE